MKNVLASQIKSISKKTLRICLAPTTFFIVNFYIIVEQRFHEFEKWSFGLIPGSSPCQLCDGVVFPFKWQFHHPSNGYKNIYFVGLGVKDRRNKLKKIQLRNCCLFEIPSFIQPISIECISLSSGAFLFFFQDFAK